MTPKAEWDAYWSEVERSGTPEMIEEPKRAARELQAEIRTVTFMMLHHKREVGRLTKELENLENRLDGIYWREEKTKEVAR
jgi:hypothetical protein